jgi:GDP-L-fucose synthase
VTIHEPAQLIGRIVGFNGEIRFDRTKPDGTPRKLLDVSRLHALGWRARTSLEDGVRAAYGCYLSELNGRGV